MQFHSLCSRHYYEASSPHQPPESRIPPGTDAHSVHQFREVYVTDFLGFTEWDSLSSTPDCLVWLYTPGSHFPWLVCYICALCSLCLCRLLFLCPLVLCVPMRWCSCYAACYIYILCITGIVPWCYPHLPSPFCLGTAQCFCICVCYGCMKNPYCVFLRLSPKSFIHCGVDARRNYTTIWLAAMKVKCVCVWSGTYLFLQFCWKTSVKRKQMEQNGDKHNWICSIETLVCNCWTDYTLDQLNAGKIVQGSIECVSVCHLQISLDLCTYSML
jgi:hypothetical protein